MQLETTQNKKFVLIDDDPTYRSIMLRFAKHQNMTLDVYDSLLELGSIGLLGRYDAAIVDYDLGQMNGVEIAEYLSSLFGDIPMVLVSDRQRHPGKRGWPASIKGFINKAVGHGHILSHVKSLATPQRGESPVREVTGEDNSANTVNSSNRILIFDDDAMYCEVMERVGKSLGLSISACTKMEDFCLKALEKDFDIALIDYDLEHFKGPEVARVIESAPTFLISGNSRFASSRAQWGEKIQGFFPKSSGAAAILKAASGAANKRKC